MTMQDTAVRVQVILAVALLVLAFATGVWDIWAMTRLDGSYTISAILQSWSSKYPILPLSVGLLMGHLFFPRTAL